MKFFLDCEFVEGTQKKTFLGIPYGTTKPTVDIISIGIIADDNQSYYAVSKDFNLKEAWNRVQITTGADEKPYYWIRENVLKLIYKQLRMRELNQEYNGDVAYFETYYTEKVYYKELKRLIAKYGKSNMEIAQEIKDFVYRGAECSSGLSQWDKENKIEFYGYYSAYDWVAFCQLYSIMMNIPDGFPWYCIDLKQELDKFIEGDFYRISSTTLIHGNIKDHENYPKQTNEHNALSDAIWNRDLYRFLESLKKK